MKRAVVLVCFGSSNMEGVNNSVGILKKEINEYFYNKVDVFVAFTSNRIIEILKRDKEIDINNLEQCLSELYDNCYEEVLIQPLYIIKGRDYNLIENLADKYKDKFKKLTINSNLFYGEKDEVKSNIEVIVNGLEEYYDSKTLLLAGHGSNSNSNEIYKLIEDIFKSQYRGGVYIATLEGEETIENKIIEMKKNNEKEVVIIPLFLIPGKHFNKDISKGDSSWSEILENNGISVIKVAKSLLEYKEIRQLYIKNIKFSENLQSL